MAEFAMLPGVNYKHDYNEIFRFIAAGKIKKIHTYRELCRNDLFFLLYFGLGRKDVNNPFVIERIREAEEEHYDTLDLWAREHYKSTILTYGLPFQEVIKNNNERIAIFSHTRPIAKGFLREIKHTLEADAPVKRWFPDVFYPNPKKESPKWSEDDGLIGKRSNTSKEATFEAWGLVDGQPISKHFTIRVYDDIVTKDSVTTPEQIKKTIDAYELSHSLGTVDGRKRVLGTHYHFADPYTYLRKKGGYKVRVKPAVDENNTPVFLSQERLDELRNEQGPYIFSCQQLLKPVSKEDQDFQSKWLKYYRELPSALNKYIVVDPAHEKKVDSAYTCMSVIGLDWLGNRFLVDMAWGKLDLSERWSALQRLVAGHWPILNVGYEKYGMQADISYIEEKQRETGFYFNVKPLGGRTSKVDRIRRLVPIFANGRFYLPEKLIYEGTDLVKIFVEEEYNFFPFCLHFDMLDSISRCEDPDFHMILPIMEEYDEGYMATGTDGMEGRDNVTGY